MHSIDITSATWKSSSSNPPPSQRGQIQTQLSEEFQCNLCYVFQIILCSKPSNSLGVKNLLTHHQQNTKKEVRSNFYQKQKHISLLG